MRQQEQEKAKVSTEVSRLVFDILVHEVEMMEKSGIKINT